MKALSAEVFSKLAVKGINIGAVGGGIPEYTSSDVSAILGLLPKDAAEYCRLKYCSTVEGGEFPPQPLERLVFLKVVDIAINSNWKAGHLRAMAGLAIWEGLRTNICPACKGTGVAFVNGLSASCSACSGSGKKGMSQVDQVRFINEYDALIEPNKKNRVMMTKEAWARIWRPRYEGEIFPLIWGYEGEIRRILEAEREPGHRVEETNKHNKSIAFN